MMRYVTILLMGLLGWSVSGEEARGASLLEQGITSLKAADADRTKLLDAIGFLTQAADRFTQEGDEQSATDANALLYWCRKKLTIDEINALQKSAPQAARKAEAVFASEVKPEDAKAWMERADAYASRVKDPLLKAVRYFEVADRFKNTPEGFKALDLSLKLMQEIAADSQRASGSARPGGGEVAGAAPVDPPAAPVATLDQFVGKWVKTDTDTVFMLKSDGTISAPAAMIRGTWKVVGGEVILTYGGTPLVLKIVNDNLLSGKYDFKRKK